MSQPDTKYPWKIPHGFTYGWSFPTLGARYQLIKLLGAGANGQVALAVDHETKTIVAIKRVSLENGLSTVREVRILKALRGHSNILQLHRIIPPTNPKFAEIYIVTQAMDADLTNLFKRPEKLLEHHLAWFSYKLLHAVAILHAKGILHRDIKPSNVFINESCAMVLGDFGLARAMGDTGPSALKPVSSTQRLHVCTRHWRPPEVILATSYSSVSPPRGKETGGDDVKASVSPPKYGTPLDIWSTAGVMAELFEMLLPLDERQGTLFPGDYSTLSPSHGVHEIRRDQLGIIIRVLGAPSPGKPVGGKNTWEAVAEEVAAYNPRAADFIRLASGKERTDEEQRSFWRKRVAGVSDSLLDLLLSMLCFRPEERITAAEALRNPCFDVVRDPRQEAELASATPVEDFADGNLREMLCEDIASLNPEVEPTWLP